MHSEELIIPDKEAAVRNSRGGHVAASGGELLAIYRNARRIASRKPDLPPAIRALFYHPTTPEKGWSRLDWHRYAREWAHRSRVRALKYWSTLYRSNKARRREESTERRYAKSRIISRCTTGIAGLTSAKRRTTPTLPRALFALTFLLSLRPGVAPRVISRIDPLRARESRCFRIARVINRTSPLGEILIIPNANWNGLGLVIQGDLYLLHRFLSVREIQCDLSCRVRRFGWRESPIIRLAGLTSGASLQKASENSEVLTM